MSGVYFECEGCGYGIHHFAAEIPRHRLCAICLWVCECVPPEKIMEARRQCEPGGWEPERERR